MTNGSQASYNTILRDNKNSTGEWAKIHNKTLKDLTRQVDPVFTKSDYQ